MLKLKMRTQNKADENYKKLAELFPNAVTETIDETTGEVVRAIDKDVLMQEINTHVVDGKEERYQFTWPDKKKSVLLANSPIAETLRPCREESVDFDNTENLYIEGDNLDVLKLLQETYLGKVKMIYIDPPYNTGNDFVYNDDFAENTDDYLDRSGQFDDDGNRLFQNTESNGRFHTDWLNMIYPRLKIARNLLSDDGVIFISIDDNEADNLRKICDEIYGEDNFINTICVETSNGLFGLKAKFANSTIVKSKDYILVYKKTQNDFEFNPLYTKSKKLFDTHFTYYKSDVRECQLNDFLSSNPIIKEKAKLLNIAPNVGNLHTLMSVFNEVNDIILSEVNNIFRIREYTLKLTSEQKELLSDGNKHLIDGVYVFLSDNKPCYLYPFSKIVKFSDDYDSKLCSCVIQGDLWKGFNDDMGNIGKEGEVKFENGKKPIRLIKNILKLINSDDCIVLDFFSGSATTAHAVMQLNAEDGGHRKFIMVQLPEPTWEKDKNGNIVPKKDATSKAAFEAGYKNICEIGKERIRRAGKKIKAQLMAEGKETRDIAEKKAQGNAVAVSKAYWIDSPEYKSANKQMASDLDTGFRVLKLDSTNMKDVYYNPAEITIDTIMGTVDNIKEDRTPEDLLFQVMLDLGVLLSSKIEKSTIGGKTVFNVEDSYLIACFDDNVTDEVITAIAKQKPYYFVMRDSSMANDSVATNFEQIFAAYSPDTVRKVL